LNLLCNEDIPLVSLAGLWKNGAMASANNG
jgi:hypothetical protein